MRLYELAMRWGRATGCHQLKERSYSFRGYQFPVCVRCTGVYIGGIAAVVFYHLITWHIWILISGVVAMLIDWSLQYFELCQSTNLRRIITGIWFGYGLTTIGLCILNSLLI